MKNQQVSITYKISKNNLIGELHERNVEFRMAKRKEDLKSKFDNEMAGVHCLPALMFGHSQSTIKELYLDSYEILASEPLHTIKGHVTNINVELPLHLSKDFGLHMFVTAQSLNNPAGNRK